MGKVVNFGIVGWWDSNPRPKKPWSVDASVFAVPIKGDTGSAEALAAAMPIAQPTPLSRSSTQKTASVATARSTVFRLCLAWDSSPSVIDGALVNSDSNG